MSDASSGTAGIILARLFALLLLAIGFYLMINGVRLVILGGSPYYVLFGVAISASAVLLWMRRAEAMLVYGTVLLATLAWALWESGDNGWALMPRVVAPAVLGLVWLLPALRRALVRRSKPWSLRRCAAATAITIGLGAALHVLIPPRHPVDPIYQAGTTAPPTVDARVADQAVDGDWPQYGNDGGGTRFSPLEQITPDNVAHLERLWTARLGDAPGAFGLEDVPLKIERSLYLCTSANDVVALDAETGKQLWRFESHVDLKKSPGQLCRGLAYYRVPGTAAACAERIFTNTTDDRLIALDAHEGKPCADFGVHGEISLLTGLGDVADGYYSVTSPPIVVRGRIVVDSAGADNQYWGQPSGVIRAFDALTGKLSWAWDLGRPDRQGEPAAGETYTPATPNAWPPMTADEERGIVFVPLGNPTPDYFGAQRRSFDDHYGTSVVALDAESGKPHWSFQIVHHDLWDYDLPSQPTLTEIPTDGGMTPAVIQATKTGELFILNRETGVPIFRVEERPVSQAGAAPEERLSPTQPFSVALPSFRGADLVEGDMWGITPLDQLWCRIKFREARYKGIFTPPGVTPSLEKPGQMGGMQWGGVAVDRSRHIAIINTSSLAGYVRLVPRAEADKLGYKRFTVGNAVSAHIGLIGPQEGTPYAVETPWFFSPLRVPCNQPPFGQLSAVDLKTGKLIWTQDFGTARQSGPLGWASKLPFVLGTPNIGGAVITRTGLFFIGATQDSYFRAYDTRTGKELWKDSLPTAGNSTPITYLTPSGRQVVVIVAGGHASLAPAGDYVIAYALPQTTNQ
jgi:membrane-bound PQQ-dependent dehydrogenase (glucose/quinate/shikimate family)